MSAYRRIYRRQLISLLFKCPFDLSPRYHILLFGPSSLEEAVTVLCCLVDDVYRTSSTHTCATLLLIRHVHPKVVQKLLGHRSIAITMDLYSHWAPAMGDQAAAAMEDTLQEADWAETEDETDAA